MSRPALEKGAEVVGQGLTNSLTAINVVDMCVCGALKPSTATRPVSSSSSSLPRLVPALIRRDEREGRNEGENNNNDTNNNSTILPSTTNANTSTTMTATTAAIHHEKKCSMTSPVSISSSSSSSSCRSSSLVLLTEEYTDTTITNTNNGERRRRRTTRSGSISPCPLSINDNNNNNNNNNNDNDAEDGHLEDAPSSSLSSTASVWCSATLLPSLQKKKQEGEEGVVLTETRGATGSATRTTRFTTAAPFEASFLDDLSSLDREGSFKHTHHSVKNNTATSTRNNKRDIITPFVLPEPTRSSIEEPRREEEEENEHHLIGEPTEASSQPLLSEMRRRSIGETTKSHIDNNSKRHVAEAHDFDDRTPKTTPPPLSDRPPPLLAFSPSSPLFTPFGFAASQTFHQRLQSYAHEQAAAAALRRRTDEGEGRNGVFLPQCDPNNNNNNNNGGPSSTCTWWMSPTLLLSHRSVPWVSEELENVFFSTTKAGRRQMMMMKKKKISERGGGRRKVQGAHGDGEEEAMKMKERRKNNEKETSAESTIMEKLLSSATPSPSQGENSSHQLASQRKKRRRSGSSSHTAVTTNMPWTPPPPSSFAFPPSNDCKDTSVARQVMRSRRDEVDELIFGEDDEDEIAGLWSAPSLTALMRAAAAAASSSPTKPVSRLKTTNTNTATTTSTRSHNNSSTCKKVGPADDIAATNSIASRRKKTRTRRSEENEVACSKPPPPHPSCSSSSPPPLCSTQRGHIPATHPENLFPASQRIPVPKTPPAPAPAPLPACTSPVPLSPPLHPVSSLPSSAVPFSQDNGYEENTTTTTTTTNNNNNNNMDVEWNNNNSSTQLEYQRPAYGAGLSLSPSPPPLLAHRSTQGRMKRTCWTLRSPPLSLSSVPAQPQDASPTPPPRRLTDGDEADSLSSSSPSEYSWINTTTTNNNNNINNMDEYDAHHNARPPPPRPHRCVLFGGGGGDNRDSTPPLRSLSLCAGSSVKRGESGAEDVQGDHETPPPPHPHPAMIAASSSLLSSNSPPRHSLCATPTASPGDLPHMTTTATTTLLPSLSSPHRAVFRICSPTPTPPPPPTTTNDVTLFRSEHTEEETTEKKKKASTMTMMTSDDDEELLKHCMTSPLLQTLQKDFSSKGAAIRHPSPPPPYHPHHHHERGEAGAGGDGDVEDGRTKPERTNTMACGSLRTPQHDNYAPTASNNTNSNNSRSSAHDTLVGRQVEEEEVLLLSLPRGVVESYSVPSPDDFLAEQRQKRRRLNNNNNNKNQKSCFHTACEYPPPLFSSACVAATAVGTGACGGSGGIEEEIKEIRWRLLVDYRERISSSTTGGGGGRSVSPSIPPPPTSSAYATEGEEGIPKTLLGSASHQHFISLLAAEGVPCASQALPSGDLMWCIDSWAKQGIGQQQQQTVGGAAQCLSVVVERKTVMDLEASVKTSRYAQQRLAMSSCSQFTLVIWIVEGEAPPVSGGGGGGKRSTTAGYGRGYRPHPSGRYWQGWRGRGGAAWRGRMLRGGRKPNTTTTTNTETPVNNNNKEEVGEEEDGNEEDTARSIAQRIFSSCASLSLHSRFCVLRTRGAHETVALLRHLSQMFLRVMVIARRLHHPGETSCIPPSLSTAPVTQPSRGRLGGEASGACECALCALLAGPVEAVMTAIADHQRTLRAQTALPRLLQGFPGCSADMARRVGVAFGSLYNFWRFLHFYHPQQQHEKKASQGSRKRCREAWEAAGEMAESSLQDHDGASDYSSRQLALSRWEKEALSTAQQRTLFLMHRFFMTWEYT